MQLLLKYSEEILSVKNGDKYTKPIVALESTIITHGMEYPHNLNTALEVEQQIREQGAIPATIAIINGIIHIGLSKEQIEFVALNKKTFQKCSRRDLASIISKQGSGSTTVAATMICAHYAGIKIFVTGGIGGVHRGAEETFDISADLIELSQTPVAVISAGAKSILDIQKTLEYLETFGVPVIGYKTQKFPNFFTSNSGYDCHDHVENAQQAARLIHAQYDILNLKNGILFAVPIPEEEAAKGEDIQKAIQQALEEAKQHNISGPQSTPFLLKRIHEITEGRSVKSNTALIKNNARVGAQIAVELFKI
ncbi:hypothetical protein pb186bvf_013251 [Paramecium bursaria]